jgi:hypothetical protein
MLILSRIVGRQRRTRRGPRLQFPYSSALLSDQETKHGLIKAKQGRREGAKVNLPGALTLNSVMKAEPPLVSLDIYIHSPSSMPPG